jgi:hypothetical protein
MEVGTLTLVLLSAAALALAAFCAVRPHTGIGLVVLTFLVAPLFPTDDLGWLFYGFGIFTMLVLLGWLYRLSRSAAPFRSIDSCDGIAPMLKAWLVLCLACLPVSLMFNTGTIGDRLYFYLKALLPFLYLLMFFVVRAIPFTANQVQRILDCLLSVGIVFAVITFAIYAATGLRVTFLYTPLAFPMIALAANVAFARMLLARSRAAVLAWGLLTSTLTFAVLLTFTKAQMIALAAGLALIAALICRHSASHAAQRITAFLAISAVAALGLALFASAQTGGDLSFSEMVSIRMNDESSTGARVSEWQAALGEFAQSPLFGKGIGHQLERDVMGESLTAAYVHNQIAYTAMTTGIAGLIIYVGLIYNWTRLVRRFDQADPALAGTLATVHGCVLTLWVYALMFATFGLIQHNLLLGLFLGLAAVMTPRQLPQAASSPQFLTAVREA